MGGKNICSLHLLVTSPTSFTICFFFFFFFHLFLGMGVSVRDVLVSVLLVELVSVVLDVSVREVVVSVVLAVVSVVLVSVREVVLLSVVEAVVEAVDDTVVVGLGLFAAKARPTRASKRQSEKSRIVQKKTPDLLCVYIYLCGLIILRFSKQ